MPLPLTPDQVNWAESAQWKVAIKQALADARCASPAFLTEDLDTNDQVVSVQVAIQELARTPNGPQWWDVPPIFRVPLVLPRGGGYSFTLPLKKGNEGLLIFCDTCFDNWWVNAQNNAPKAVNASSPSGSQRQAGNADRRHATHDCGFLPGMSSQPNKLTNYSSTTAQLRRDDGNAMLEVADGEVSAHAQGGTALPLLNDNFYQWFVSVYMPSVQYKVAPPELPTQPETSILKGQ